MATFCDFCLADGERAPLPTKSLSVALNEARYLIDACERHRKPLEELAAWLAEHVPPIGAETPPAPASAPVAPSVAQESPAPAKRPSRPQLHPSLTCPRCKGKPFANRGSLASHARQIHKMTLAELEGSETPYACPDCGLRFAYPQGLGVHRRVHESRD